MEITREKAFGFMKGDILKDVMLEKYFPKQMQVYHQAIEQTREQLLSSLDEPAKREMPELQLNL